MDYIVVYLVDNDAADTTREWCSAAACSTTYRSVGHICDALAIQSDTRVKEAQKSPQLRDGMMLSKSYIDLLCARLLAAQETVTGTIAFMLEQVLRPHRQI